MMQIPVLVEPVKGNGFRARGTEPFTVSFLDGSPFGYGPLELVRDIRVAFFFHYLDRHRPLLTPGGPIPLPEPVARPERLSVITYEPPS
jgi:hypothetical protein